MKTKKGGSRLKAGRESNPVVRALVEMAFIIFLFYSNLLMGEFTRANAGQGKSLLSAMQDVVTPANFCIAVVSALVGYLIFEFLRKKI
ncbi:MAG TPA: hypothetical protein VK914_00015 [bacterium]|nr:hypothetical protein [bacterium]